MPAVAAGRDPTTRQGAGQRKNGAPEKVILQHTVFRKGQGDAPTDFLDTLVIVYIICPSESAPRNHSEAVIAR